MKNILIIGNSGSGKSWLASRLARVTQTPVVHLDTLVWEPGSYTAQRSEVRIDHEISLLAKTSPWIIEGVFGALAEQLLPSADTLVFLDVDWPMCHQALLSRGVKNAMEGITEKSTESETPQQAAAAEKSFQTLVQWASEYYTRQSKSSLYFHQQLFESFEGDKQRLTQRDQVARFLASVSSESTAGG